tara:strand:- start:5516 stop:6946 length:1431 start_codon:yes stop_codon:yes gene_type:complete
MKKESKKSEKKSVSIRAIKEELWRRGILEWKLKKSQKLIETEFRKTKGKLFVSNCSRRFGKSFWAASKCLEKALSSPKSKIKFASAFANDLEEIIIPAFRFLMEDIPEDLEPDWNIMRKKYTFPNGSEIQLIGLDRNPDGPRGQALDLMVFEEAGFINRLDYLYSSIIVPTFRGRPGAKAIMISTPPISPDHPFKVFCEKAQAEGAFAEFTIYDDPEIKEAEIEEYKKECLSETDWQREYLVKFVIDKDRSICPEFNDSFIGEYKKDEYWQFYHTYSCMDLGVRDKTACLFAVWDFLQAKLIILDEYIISGPDMTTDLLVKDLKKKEAEVFQEKKTYLRIADNNNLLLLQDLGTLHKMPFMATTKDSLEAMVNKLRLWMKSGKILISPKCRELIGCLKSGVWNKRRSEFDRSQIYGHFDALASLIYLVRNIRENSNPIPAGYKISHDSHWIDKLEKKSENNKALAKAFGRRKRYGR